MTLDGDALDRCPRGHRLDRFASCPLCALDRLSAAVRPLVNEVRVMIDLLHDGGGVPDQAIADAWERLLLPIEQVIGKDVGRIGPGGPNHIALIAGAAEQLKEKP